MLFFKSNNINLSNRNWFILHSGHPENLVGTKNFKLGPTVRSNEADNLMAPVTKY